MHFFENFHQNVENYAPCLQGAINRKLNHVDMHFLA
jgi:hypothetical protein